ncbi:MAG: guanine deaminase [Janthinobacterium lividum]
MTTPRSPAGDPDIALRGRLLHFVGDPTYEPNAARYHSDGLLYLRDGHVAVAGDYDTLRGMLPADLPIREYGDKLITPGFIDAHVHMPQIDMIASPAPGLLPWLDDYTYPTEQRFADPAHAAEVATFFVDQLLAHGTTTALVYCTVHPQSAEAFFQASHARNLRMVAGKVMMDRHAPELLRDTSLRAFEESEALIQRWHGRGRQHYALTPRFAPTSTHAQLEACGALAAQYPDVFVQSHLAESRGEVDWVSELFPERRSYLDVYEHYGLLRPRAVYGHCLWIDDTDRERMAASSSLVAHCPTSNLFLGSGQFDWRAADMASLQVGLATDVGAGTSLSMLQTMNEAHKVARMNDSYLSALRMFYLASAGTASALGLGQSIGHFAPGAEADFIVLDPRATPLLARRTSRVESLEELLFAFATLGDDRAVYETWSMGQRVHSRDD